MDDSHQEERIATKKPVRVLIVDDHAVVRQGTRSMLLRMPELEVMGECADGDELLAFLREKIPQIVLLDIHLPGQNGLQLLAQLKPEFPQIKFVMFSAHIEAQYIAKARQLGADGYPSKTMDEAELQAALMQVMQNDPAWVVSPDVASLPQTAQAATQAQLTARELEILSHLGQGLTNQAIAKTLCLSVKTVDTHVANLMKKTGARNRTQLLAYAYEHRLL